MVEKAKLGEGEPQFGRIDHNAPGSRFLVPALCILFAVTVAARFTSLTLNSFWSDELLILEGASRPLSESIRFF